MSETDDTQAEKKRNNLPRYRGYSRLTTTGNTGHLSIPAELMSVLTGGLLFKPELTKDGILFRITDENKMIADEKAIPAWAKKTTKPTRTTNTGDLEPDITDSADDDDEVEEDDEPPVTEGDEEPF